MAKIILALALCASLHIFAQADPILKNDNFCETNDGEKGICTTFKECYPVLSLFASPTLQEEVMNVATPCNSKDLIIRDEKDIVCCPGKVLKDGPRPDTRIVEVLKQFEPKETFQQEGDVDTTTSTTEAPLVDSSCGGANVVNVVAPPNEVNAPIGAYPYMAALVNSRGSQFCGGSLIDNYHVLTAAHCIAHFKKPSDLAKFKIYLGAHNLPAMEPNRMTFNVERIMQHGEYDDSTITNDVAILRLTAPVTFNKYMQPVCLNSRDGYDDGKQMATLSGWGRTSAVGGPSPVLRHGTMRVWTNTECKNRYSQTLTPGLIPEVQSGMVCAGSPGVDACQGDSGGPLVMKRNNNTHYEQIGVVSWGIGCGVYPGVYTRVDQYLPWINKNRGTDNKVAVPIGN